jgi:outer membrane murein-binding lipoprotein Lpp
MLNQIAQIGGPVALVAAVGLLYLARRVAAGQLLLISTSGSELKARAEKAEAERDQARKCEAHQRDEASKARQELIEYLQRDSQRVQLREVEALAKEKQP